MQGDFVKLIKRHMRKTKKEFDVLHKNIENNEKIGNYIRKFYPNYKVHFNIGAEDCLSGTITINIP